MLSFKDLSTCGRLDGFSFFMCDFDENGEAKNEHPRIAHYLKKSQHNLGEYSSKQIMMHEIPSFAKDL